MSGGPSLERELKLALADPADLPRLLEALPEPDTILEQRNHYLVDPDHVLQRRRLMVRVREERMLPSGVLVGVILTLKRRTRSRDGYFEAEEHEASLESGLWERIQRGEASLLDLDLPELEPLRALELGPLMVGAQMTNVRHRISLGGFCLEVDLTTFPGGRVDAEVEVETDRPEEARALIVDLAGRAGVSLLPQTTGKYTRLQQILQRKP